MRWVTFVDESSARRPGAMMGAAIVDLIATDPSLPRSVKELLEQGDEGFRRAAAVARSPAAVRRSDVKLLAPIPDPEKVVCVGLNYRDHAAESGAPIPRDPVIFNKFPTAVIGPDEPIQLPSMSEEVDYEAELVVVIGRVARNVSADRAMDVVAGYTIGNDVSARDWQIKKDGKQWLLGKSFDTFAPMGPALVTKDEIPDPGRLPIRLLLNGEAMQESSTSQMIFSVAKLVSYVSQVATLKPGDVVFTGTPPGVGFARKPPVYLRPGDVCEVQIDGLGVLRNSCVQGA